MSVEKQVQVISEEIRQSLIENFGTGKRPSKADIAQSLMGSLDMLTRHEKIHKESRVATNLLWDKWNDDQKKTWQFCNEIFPEIGETTRRNIHELNLLKVQSATEEQLEYGDVERIQVPWWAVCNPTEILIVDVHVKPVQSLDFVTLNFVMEEGKRDA